MPVLFVCFGWWIYYFYGFWIFFNIVFVFSGFQLIFCTFFGDWSVCTDEIVFTLSLLWPGLHLSIQTTVFRVQLTHNVGMLSLHWDFSWKSAMISVRKVVGIRNKNTAKYVRKFIIDNDIFSRNRKYFDGLFYYHCNLSS